MFEKLGQIEKKFYATEAKLSDPAVISDMAQYTALMKEYSSMKPVVDKYQEYKAAEKDLADARECAASADEELRELAREQETDARERSDKAAEELKILLLPKDPNDDKNVVVEIRSGAGGDEAALFAYVLPFIISSAGGTVIAIFLVTALKQTHALDKFFGDEQ